jgi:hypothetical protein
MNLHIRNQCRHWVTCRGSGSVVRPEYCMTMLSGEAKAMPKQTDKGNCLLIKRVGRNDRGIGLSRSRNCRRHFDNYSSTRTPVHLAHTGLMVR